MTCLRVWHRGGSRAVEGQASCHLPTQHLAILYSRPPGAATRINLIGRYVTACACVGFVRTLTAEAGLGRRVSG